MVQNDFRLEKDAIKVEGLEQSIWTISGPRHTKKVGYYQRLMDVPFWIHKEQKTVILFNAE